MEDRSEIRQLANELQASRQILSALGDEVRQHIIIVMMQEGSDCGGMRVGEIARRTSLSRPAVSHHLQILKNAGILRVRKEGTRNFYYFDERSESMDRLIGMLLHARRLMGGLPDRSETDWNEGTSR